MKPGAHSADESGQGDGTQNTPFQDIGLEHDNEIFQDNEIGLKMELLRNISVA